MHSFIYVLIHLFTSSSIYVSIHLFIDSSIYPFIHISIYLLIHCLSTDSILIHYLSIDSFIYLFIDLYIIDFSNWWTNPSAPVGVKGVCLWGGTNNRLAFARGLGAKGILWPLSLSPIFCSGRQSGLQFGPNFASCAILSPDEWQQELSQCLQKHGWITSLEICSKYLKITAAYTNVKHVEILQTQAF